jgi:hypothetical protein
MCVRGAQFGEEGERHTDDVLEVFPVVVNKLLIGHGQELVIEVCEIESRRHISNSNNKSVLCKIDRIDRRE